MDLRRLDLNLLVVFDTVLTERSVTRAADRLALTQPAVSHALQRLRAACGDDIVRRQGHTMVPTPHAMALHPEVRAILVRAQRVFSLSSAFDPQTTTRQFQVGCSDHAATALLGPLLGSLLAEAPGLRLQLLHVGRSNAADMLRAGALDLALGLFNSADDAIAVRTVREVPYVCAMRTSHPLARGPFTLARYLGAQHLQVLVQPGSFGGIDQTLARLGHERNIRLVAAHFGAALGLLGNTDLLLTVPRDLLPDRPAEAGLCIRALPYEADPFRHQIAYARHATDDPGMAWLLTFLTAMPAGAAARARSTGTRTGSAGAVRRPR
ncbi:MAG: LysR family transcriptional regulator [Hydrogenophaga sp.]|uniref:LysR family transcriptional regulator n=1 Tax=Hydrogenophaga sp. TaxID=1904254 RepID=UPI001D795918|nr:LysR family transcriptional regulator [Hydrogenophaga sp.]MBX3608719.1 LysR family transcriptional regulator [Hydrogenophaga sp.]